MATIAGKYNDTPALNSSQNWAAGADAAEVKILCYCEAHSSLTIAPSRILYEHIFINLITESDNMKTASTIIECTNHFQSGGSEPSKDEFVSKWIELVNRLEKNISIGLTNQ